MDVPKLPVPKLPETPERLAATRKVFEEARTKFIDGCITIIARTNSNRPIEGGMRS
jgi:hypothetical protein